MKTVVPRRGKTILESRDIGVRVSVNLVEEQKWKARKKGKHWHLSRRGVCAELILTDKVFNEYFEDYKGGLS